MRRRVRALLSYRPAHCHAVDVFVVDLTHRVLAVLEKLLRRVPGFGDVAASPRLRVAALVLGVLLVFALGLGALAAVRAVVNAPASRPVVGAIQTTSARAFTLRGTLQQMAPAEWVVEEFLVALNEQTRVAGSPAIGGAVTVEGSLRDDGTLLARAITVAADAPPTAMVGAATPDSAPTAVPADPATATVPAEPPATVSPPQVADDPIVALRMLIDAGIADGRTNREGGVFLLTKLDEVQQAIAAGKEKTARDRLREMERRVREQLRQGAMTADFARLVLDGIDAIGAAYSIRGAFGNGAGFY